MSFGFQHLTFCSKYKNRKMHKSAQLFFEPNELQITQTLGGESYVKIVACATISFPFVKKL